MTKKRALILGITGQDGSYLADILLKRGYEVHGMCRRSSVYNVQRIEHLLKPVKLIELHQGDMLDPVSIQRIIEKCRPNEIYNEADQDNVGWSYKTPGYSYQITSAAVGNLLEIVRKINDEVKVFIPVTAMMFGDAVKTQNENTPFNPQSPYACAKVMAYHLARYYRQVHGMFVCTGILYNHDSPRRTEDYLLHKIAHSAVRIANGGQEKLGLGNLSMIVDIGYAKEYMEAAVDMMQLDTPDDYVIATGDGYSIEDLTRYAFELVKDVNGMSKVHIDPNFYRPGKLPELVGDYRKAFRVFGFTPKYDAMKVIKMLIDSITEKNQSNSYQESHQI